MKWFRAETNGLAITHCALMAGLNQVPVLRRFFVQKCLTAHVKNEIS